MRSRLFIPFLLTSGLVATGALASMSGSKPETPSPTSDVPQVETSQTTDRQRAERLYGDAYNEVAKAKQDLTNEKKKKNAEKRFKKALDRAQQAVELDSTYYEAWNLVGFCARNLGNYDRSIAAYQRSLQIKPDYAAAREYLGEAYVESGQPEKAREQLAWLQRLNAPEEAASLKVRIDAWAAAHPEASAAAPAATSADSSAAPAKESPH